MTVYCSGLFLLGSLLVAPMAQAHPGHQHDGGLLASIVHSFMSMGPAWLLLAIGVGYGLWAVGRRITQTRQHARRR